jgi:hypothetical protein
MPWASVVLTPGGNVEQTATLNQAGYLRTENGRFKAGLFQKLGGWEKFVDAVFGGTPKSLWAWLDLNAIKRLSVATTTGVTVVASGVLSDITPQTFQSDFAPDFSTTIGSRIVEIDDPNVNGITTDVVIELRTPIAVGGIILSGSYPVVEIVGASTYRIEAQTEALSTEANGGVVPEFNTTTGSSIVGVDLVGHDQTDGNEVVFPIATPVGGLTVLGKYVVTDIVDGDTFEINASEAASSNASADMNGGDAQIIYYIALGPAPSGIGYGVGPYGEGGYGKGTSGTGVQTGTPLGAVDWTQDNWGEILIATPQGGGIYYWQPGTGFQNLSIIPEGPLYNAGAFVSMAQQQIIAYGSTVNAREAGGIGAYQDPLLVKWSDIGDFFEWDQLPENFARQYRIPTGSKCVGGAASKNRNLIWTDLDLHAFVYNGGDSVYTPNRVGSNCGLIGVHAWAQQADTVYWMGVGNFFSYAGSGVTPIPCSVWDAVFQDLHPDHQHKTVAASNSDFTELWWFYPSLLGGGTLDKFAKYNVIESTWDNGSMDRCAWIDRSVLGNPIGASSAGILYSHEKGFDDDGNPLMPVFETGDFYIDEGEDFVFIDEIFPDFKWGLHGGSETAQIRVTLLCRDFPGDTVREYGPFVTGKATPSINPAASDGTRIRTKQVALRVDSIDVGSFWRLGKVRFRYSPDGRR